MTKERQYATLPFNQSALAEMKRPRIGRCNRHNDRPNFVWEDGTLKLDEARCLRCGHLLDQTTIRQNESSMKRIPREEQIKMLDRAARESYSRMLDEMTTARSLRDAGEDEFKVGLNEKWAKHYRARHADQAKRLRKLYRAEAA